MPKKMKMMDGNMAASYISYAFTEVAGIYPITGEGCRNAI